MVKFIYKKSDVSGYGLFANTDIKTDETICYYVGTKVDVPLKFEFEPYGIQYDEQTIIIAETDINKLPPEGYAQFLNDGGFVEMNAKQFIKCMNSLITHSNMEASLNEFVDETTIDLLGECLWYKFNSSKTSNVRFHRDTKKKTIIIKSIKDIEKGEELFVEYGVNYWIGYCLEKHKEHIFNIQTAYTILNYFTRIIEQNLELIAEHVRKRLQQDKKKLNIFNAYITFIIENKVKL